MRVSHLFYTVAGAVLYREIDNKTFKSGKFLEGCEVQDRCVSTRQRPSAANLKLSLLESVRCLTLTSHNTCGRLEDESILRVVKAMSRVSTIRWCQRRSCCLSHYCRTNFDDPERCYWIRGLRAQKLVLDFANNGIVHSDNVLPWFSYTFPHLSTITIISLEPAHYSSKECLRRLTDALGAASAAKLRLIVKLTPDVLDTDLSLNLIVDYIGSMLTVRAEIIVYLLAGLGWISHARDWDEVPLIRIEREVHAYALTHGTIDYKVAFRYRSKYLEEGVVDELTPGDMQKLRLLEVRSLEERESESFRIEMVRSKALMETSMEAEGRELAEGSMIAVWLEQWIEEDRATRELARDTYEQNLLLNCQRGDDDLICWLLAEEQAQQEQKNWEVMMTNEKRDAVQIERLDTDARDEDFWMGFDEEELEGLMEMSEESP